MMFLKCPDILVLEKWAPSNNDSLLHIRGDCMHEQIHTSQCPNVYDFSKVADAATCVDSCTHVEPPLTVHTHTPQPIDT